MFVKLFNGGKNKAKSSKRERVKLRARKREGGKELSEMFDSLLN